MEIHTQHHASMSTLSNKINNDRADGHICYKALPGFNDLGHSVTPIPPLMDHFLYQYYFLHLAKK